METTLSEKIHVTLHALADSRKAVGAAVTVLSAALTTAFGFVFAALAKHLGFGLTPDLIAMIPVLAGGLAVLIVAAGVSYVHGQGLADTGKEAEIIKAENPVPPHSLGSPEAQAALRELVAESVKAALVAKPSDPPKAPVA